MVCEKESVKISADVSAVHKLAVFRSWSRVCFRQHSTELTNFACCFFSHILSIFHVKWICRCTAA